MEIIRTTAKGYKWDKRIFWLCMLFMVGLGVYIASLYDFNFTPRFYFKCDMIECENPIYIAKYQAWQFGEVKEARYACDWCGKPKLPLGVYGEEEPAIVHYFLYLGFAVIILGVLANHFIHNRGKTMDIGTEQYGKLTKYLSKLKDGETDEKTTDKKSE